MSWACLVAATLAPAAGAEELGVIFPPWWQASHALAAAAESGGDIVAVGAVPTILVMHFSAPDGAARLRAAGAVLVIDPQGLRGCTTRIERGGTTS